MAKHANKARREMEQLAEEFVKLTNSVKNESEYVASQGDLL
jgi:hypothetical protein